MLGLGSVSSFGILNFFLKIFRNFLLDSGLLPISRVDELDKAVARKIEEAVLAAQKAPYPDPNTLITDVYESY